MEVPAVSSTFAPAPSCTQDIYYAVVQTAYCFESDGTEVACRYFHLGPTTSTSDCFPTNWEPTVGAYISPGACPQGYTTACADTAEAEKTATCCPSGFGCQTTTTGFPWYQTDLCVQTMATTVTYVYTTRTPGKEPETTSTTGPGGLNAFGVEIRWHDSDLGIAATTTISSTAASSSTSKSILRTSSSASTSTVPIMSQSGARTSTTPITSSFSSTSTGTELPAETSQASSSGGLSTGAKAGIGIGAVVGFLLILVDAFLMWRLWQKRKRDRAAVPDASLPPNENFQQEKGMSVAGSDGATISGPLLWPYQYATPSELASEREPAEIGPGRR
ncbi:hypothetical protein F4677DRAFT_407773 [Hypoxylon crocopeplum]|nr:hypothetical protein F4677DRAFT_407773 [Hypoxylon crocopeplum]